MAKENSNGEGYCQRFPDIPTNPPDESSDESSSDNPTNPSDESSSDNSTKHDDDDEAPSSDENGETG
ncbi:10329_t:CDS:2 [Acaulospora colombiana]|uniref:10329_t:CDS:1 n=1 Tax=Acaulospora colombiana TaxID=27376 RepID=A0ACA9JX94_9GLOM|nr:10329_t:CDS:2 [Acaulospora colombiana]